MEIELRYKVYNPKEFLADLPAGIQIGKQERLIDQWYAPQTVRSMAQEKEWFDKNKGVAWRIRRSGPGKIELASKQLTSHNNHNSFHETVSPITDYAEAESWLAAQDYRNWLTIDKTRTWLTIANEPQVEVVLDFIAGLKEKIGIGACLELEYKGPASRNEALAHLRQVASQFGFTDKDLFEKSLTVVSMDALAEF